MPLLLDTHAFAWWAFDDQRLSHDAFEAIQQDESVFVSPVVAWGVAGKVRSGRWPEAEELSRCFLETVTHYGMLALPITLQHAHLAGSMPGAHRDPFDRMLAAQAITERMPLVTADPAFRHFNVDVVW